MSRLNQIRKLAHQYYVESGHASGHDLENWLIAEREVDQAINRDRIVLLGWFIISIVILLCADHSRLPRYLFWGTILSIIFFTIYSTIHKVVDNDLLRCLRALFLSLVVALPAFTFLFQYWPEADITRAINIKAVDKTNDYMSHIPEQAAFIVKNYSPGLIRGAQVRYWLVMKAEEIENACTITYSTSSENFTLGPNEERLFMFHFGPFKNLKIEEYSVRHIHLIAQVRYRPVMFPFIEQKRWQALYYSNADGFWSLQRKQKPGWDTSLDDWYKQLDDLASSMPVPLSTCLPGPATDGSEINNTT